MIPSADVGNLLVSFDEVHSFEVVANVAIELEWGKDSIGK
jgi:hypothetical protein